MTVHDAELHALYQPKDVDCHAQLFFNPVGDYEPLPRFDQHPDHVPWPQKAHDPLWLDATRADMERLVLWNEYIPPENAPGSQNRRCIIAAEDCEHFPDAPQDAEVPSTWVWENPHATSVNLTVSPSIGYGKEDSGEWRYHFFVEGGEVRNV